MCYNHKVLICCINSVFTLATSEPCQTDLVPSDISRLTGTCQVPVVLLISALELNQSGTVLKLLI